MRFLTKFYSFIKSIYLNNSKYSNNLRHSLRLFFEREVKTKHTPTLFGSTFKGSKWVDYQTFNINKFFIKSGLSYFNYIFLTLLATFIFLGRSKSEQYFGFLPFFSYINFFIGYISIIGGDILSQFIILVYILYTLVYKAVYWGFNKLTNAFNFLNYNQEVYTLGHTSINTTSNSLSSFFWEKPTQLFKINSTISNNPVKISKLLSQVRKDLQLTNYNNTQCYNLNTLLSSDSLFHTTLVSKTYPLKNNTNGVNTITLSEALYTLPLSTNNFKIHNLITNLNTVNTMSKVKHYPSTFNFNIKHNLDVSNQQRWLTKNSLLTESIVNNSFLITQSKKLIGTGLLNKDFSNQNLWLPSQSSKLSSIESYIHFKNISQQFTQKTNNINFLKTSNINTSTNFNNLNFFENSRLFLVKKYFFVNNTSFNYVTSVFRKPILNDSLLTSNNINSPKIVYNLNTYKTLLTHLLNSPVTPSNIIKVDKHMLKNTVSNNTLLNLTTPNLDILNTSNIQFLTSLTSNFNELGNTNYFGYFNSSKVCISTNNKLQNIKFHNSI